jgi:hypothetical protein
MNRMKKILTFVFIAYAGMGYAGNELTPTLKEHVYFLASDSLEGRGPGTRGIELAAEYIADAFEDAGLKPGGDDDGYFQQLEITIGVKAGDGNSVTLDEKPVKFKKDFVPLGFSENGSVRGRLAFAGYGIKAEEYKYDDFKDRDLEGKVALILIHEPGEKDSTSVFDGVDVTPYSDMRGKAIRAKTNGAIAAIFISGPVHHPQDEPLPEISGNSGYQNVGIPVIRMRRHVLDDLLGDGVLLKMQRALESKTHDAELVEIEPVQVDIQVDLSIRKGILRNVIGWIPGSVDSLRDKPLIIGAHYDHLGYGGPNSRAPGVHEIHNGADDNASGVAALIETGRLLKTREMMKRPVILIAFSGEEIGLIGSTFYANHTDYDISEAVAMLNLDTVGRMTNNKLIVFGGGTAKEWNRAVNGLNYGHRFDLTLQMDGYGPSDQAAFYARGLPVLHLFTGANIDYHKPGDDADKLNYDDLARVTKFVTDLAEYLGNRESALTLATPSDATAMSGAPANRPAGGHGGTRPWFGSVPDFTYQEGDGLRLNGVSPGSPCEKSGLAAGDIVIRMDDIEIKSIYELNQVLKSRKAGDTVKVKYIRDGEENTVDVVLMKR